MVYDRAFSIMLSVSAVLVYIGIVLSTYPQAAHGFWGGGPFEIAEDYIVYPCWGGGVILILVGMMVLIAAHNRWKNWKKRALVRHANMP